MPTAISARSALFTIDLRAERSMPSISSGDSAMISEPSTSDSPMIHSTNSVAAQPRPWPPIHPSANCALKTAIPAAQSDQRQPDLAPLGLR